ncbi:MAG: radical SAM protein [Deltaproteobacteria bacterium]|nr:radical SAM protein [Deltaproteobacteria bacterium]MBW2016645.1 radical SAM protein [Deltaproteobacteria bacterium]MBW2303753.1 radical SAM protein [Deltaproteobacteria bacterium]
MIAEISEKSVTGTALGVYGCYESCRLCPRECRVNRLEEEAEGTGGVSLGYCGESSLLRVSYVGPHFGEEPPISGVHGSGTVFFSGCSLQCSFCQNHQISRGGLGEKITIGSLIQRVEAMILEDRVHNVNLVTPDHFFPHVHHLVSALRGKGYELPIVYNLSGYQSKRMLEMARDVVDIYLPDFKYADAFLSRRFSKCRDYPAVALDAISEMVRQKGFLDSFETGRSVARRGVLVRHLILPGKIQNSLDALTSLFLEFGPHLPLSLMSQYTPALPQKDDDLNRYLKREEFETIYNHALDLGFDRLFVQFPESPRGRGPSPSPFFPDFRRRRPFGGGSPETS